MSRKIINLDDKATMAEITIGGKTFEISRVVLRLREMYGDYVQHSGGYLQEVYRLRDEEKLDDMQELAEVYAKEKAVKLDAMMEKLLTKNGYEYDPEWWAENVGSYQEMEQFITACLTKDQEDDKKKVEEATAEK